MAHPSSGSSRLVPVLDPFNADMLAKTPVICAEDVVRSLKTAGAVSHSTFRGTLLQFNAVGRVNTGPFHVLGDSATVLSFPTCFWWWGREARGLSSGCHKKMKVILSPVCSWMVAHL